MSSLQSGLGVGCMLAPAEKSCVGWVYVRSCARKHFPVLCCEGSLNPASLTQCDESQRIEVHITGSR